MSTGSLTQPTGSDGTLHREGASVDASMLLRVLVVAAVASSSFVMMQPAPCDLFFLAMLVVALVSGHALLPAGLGFPAYLGLYLFVFANVLSLLFVDNVTEGLFFVAITFYVLVNFLCFAGLIGRHGTSMLDLITRAYCAAAVIATVIGILALFHKIPNPEIFFRDGSGYRVKSTFKDPNVFAPFLVGAILLTLSDLVSGRRALRAHLPLLGLFSVGVIIAFSRGAFVHLAVSLAVFGFLHVVVVRHSGSLKRLAMAVVPLVLLLPPLIGYVLMRSDQADYLSERMSFQSYDSERFGTQAYAIAVAQENPLGIGPGQWTHERFGRATHNLYLRILTENGLLGAVGFAILAGWCLWTCWCGVLARGRNVDIYLVSLAILTGAFVESIVIDTLHWRHFFLILAMPMGLWIHEQAGEPSSEVVQ